MASRRRAGQRGSSLITTIALTGILALLVLASLSFARSGTQQTARQGRADIAIQVADAGVNRYISRLVEDPRYFDHFVDLAEDPRVDPYGVVRQPGSAWTPGVPWTYQAGPPKTWTDLQDGRYGKAAYSLRITPPPTGSDIVTVLATGKADRTSAAPVTRTIQSQIRPTSIADYQMISNATIRYGSGATTTGKLYSARDINHQGEAFAPAYAARWTCSNGYYSDCPSPSVPSSVFKKGAFSAATNPSFSDEFPVPIDFGHFTDARLDVKDAATAQGRYFNAADATAWMIQFLADGRARVFKITGGQNPGGSIATGGLGCPVSYTLPAGNAFFYFEQPVVVSDGSTRTDNCTPVRGVGPRPSIVNGRVTVATRSNVYVGGNIDYAQPGDDVLGLIAGDEVIITSYTPRNLTWRAASLAQAGQWRTYLNNEDGNHDSMLYIGAQATSDGGYASMFREREYRWDETLARLRPPLYPILEGSWETYYWREVLPPA